MHTQIARDLLSAHLLVSRALSEACTQHAKLVETFSLEALPWAKTLSDIAVDMQTADSVRIADASIQLLLPERTVLLKLDMPADDAKKAGERLTVLHGFVYEGQLHNTHLFSRVSGSEDELNLAFSLATGERAQ